MGQLTIARFRGDTTFGLVARILATFLGSVVGMVLWRALLVYCATLVELIFKQVYIAW
jgi:hypothetical protein